MWNSMSIKRKLIAAFLIVGLFSALVGFFGIGAIYNTNKNTNKIYSDHYIPATYMYGIQKNLLEINNTFNLMLYERDILQSDKRSEAIASLQTENEKLMAQLGKTEVSEELYKTLKNDMAKANEVTEKLNTVLLDFDYTGAMNLAPDYHAKIRIVNQDIEKLIENGIEISNISLLNSQRTFLFAFLIMIGISILCLASAFAAGTILSRKIGNPITDLAGAAEMLSLGNVDVSVKTDCKDEIGHLVNAFETMTENIKMNAYAAQQIAEGNLTVDIVPKSENDVLGNSMRSVVSTLHSLVKESNEMTLASLDGDLEHRGNEELFYGGYHDIIHGFNQTLEALLLPLNTSTEYLHRISEGDIPDLITDEYPGDFTRIRDSLNTCIQTVREMTDDVNMLSEAAIKGELHIRADISKHKGYFKKIVAGFNETLDTVVDPLYIAAEYISKIGKGEIPPRLTQTYYGEFNDIKNSINACLEGLDALVEGNRLLGKMRVNDFTGQMTGNGQGIFLEISESINDVSSNVNEIIGYMKNVAEGDFRDLDHLQEIGKRSENDSLIPSITAMMENLKRIIEEINTLSESAISGHLDQRGSAGNFRGEYQKIIEGINQTLNAIVEPMTEASFVLKEMSTGNLEVFVRGDYQGDHAEIKHAVNSSIRSLLNYIGEIDCVLFEISQGNLDISITQEYEGNFIQIKNSLNHIILTLNQVMGDINQSAEYVTTGARQMLDSSQSLAQGAMEQACAIEELSASIAETAEHLKKSSAISSKANGLAVSALDRAQQGNIQMESMLHSMDRITDSSNNISKVIKAIDDIAFQTNILALNAAVEAARAGQHGKGFAVVADEVKRLALRSVEEAKKTAFMINESIQSAQDGSETVQNAAKVFQEIYHTVDRVAEITADIEKSSGEQASSIVIINQGVEQVSQVVQKNSAMAEESAAMSEKLLEQAEVLDKMVSNFRYQEQPENTESLSPFLLTDSINQYGEQLCS